MTIAEPSASDRWSAPSAALGGGSESAEMRIVITGAAGMLGEHLSRKLADACHETVGVDIRQAPQAGRTSRHIVGDIRDPEVMSRAIIGADAVVHCASALPSYQESEIDSVIVEGTRMALAAARAAGVPRFIHVSSTAVYGLPEIVPTPETHPLRPCDAYGRAKVKAEELCLEFRGEGHCTPILRPKTFLGPGRLGLFSMLFAWADEGRNFPVLGSGNVRSQMLGIEDLTDAVMTALTAQVSDVNDTFNIAAGEFGTLREDFQAVLDAAGHGGRVVSLPARPALALLRVLAAARLSPIYDRLAHKLTSDSLVSIEKAKQCLGFKPRISNVEAILSTYEWWQRQQAAGTLPSSGRTSDTPWRQGALAIAKRLI